MSSFVVLFVGGAHCLLSLLFAVCRCVLWLMCVVVVCCCVVLMVSLSVDLCRCLFCVVVIMCCLPFVVCCGSFVVVVVICFC